MKYTSPEIKASVAQIKSVMPKIDAISDRLEEAGIAPKYIYVDTLSSGDDVLFDPNKSLKRLVSGALKDFANKGETGFKTLCFSEGIVPPNDGTKEALAAEMIEAKATQGQKNALVAAMNAFKDPDVEAAFANLYALNDLAQKAQSDAKDKARNPQKKALADMLSKMSIEPKGTGGRTP